MTTEHQSTARGFALGVVVLAGLIAIDVETAGDVVLIGTFAIAPLIAATLCTPAATGLVAVLAAGAAIAAPAWDDGLSGHDHAIRTLIVATVGVAATVIASLLRRREARLQQLTAVAEQAQRAVLRAIPSSVGPIGFAAKYVSAAQEALVGGDLYE